jgi:hypothetical protein
MCEFIASTVCSARLSSNEEPRDKNGEKRKKERKEKM